MDAENTAQAPHKIGPNSTGSNQENPAEWNGQTYLPGLVETLPDHMQPGAVTIGVGKQVDALRRRELITAEHEGQVALAVATALEIDRETRTGGKAYGKAQLLSALNAILENLPKLEVTASPELDRALDMILKGD